nr:hypothetical protein [Shahe heteroptera virus 2]
MKLDLTFFTMAPKSSNFYTAFNEECLLTRAYTLAARSAVYRRMLADRISRSELKSGVSYKDVAQKFCNPMPPTPVAPSPPSKEQKAAKIIRRKRKPRHDPRKCLICKNKAIIKQERWEARQAKKREKELRIAYLKREAKRQLNRRTFQQCSQDIVVDLGDLAAVSAVYSTIGARSRKVLPPPERELHWYEWRKNRRKDKVPSVIQHNFTCAERDSWLESLKLEVVSGTKKPRSLMLLYKLKQFMPHYRQGFSGANITPIMYIFAQGEMADAHPTSELDAVDKVEIAENTAIESHAGTSTTVVEPMGDLLAMSSSMPQIQDIPELTARWLRITTFMWKGTDEGLIKTIRLPKDAVDILADNPSLALLKYYRYFRGDMQVRIVLNANRLQVGSLQASWYYSDKQDDKFQLRNNVFSGSTLPHVILDSSTSNDAEFLLPFRHVKSYIPTNNRADQGATLDLGVLMIRVLNKLTVTSSTYNACNVSVFIKFVNVKLAGLAPSNLRENTQVEGQMMPIAASMAMRVLNEINADPNRDMPPYTGPPNIVVPQTAQTFCLGSNVVEPLNAMRLDARGQTPFPEGSPEELTVPYITSKFGLVKILTWSANDSPGDQLARIPASPFWGWDFYQKYVVDSMDCYTLPPVTVMSQLFAYWRGTLELRVDVVASAFHTGRILVGYLPQFADKSKNISLDQVLGGTYQIFDIAASKQIVFSVPFVSDTPWWPRETSNLESTVEIGAPGHVYIFVLNGLIPMDSVSSTVYLNVYFRGGSDFELAVPIQPAIGLSFNPTQITPSVKGAIYARQGYAPWYLGTWRYLYGGKKLIARYGPVSDHVAQFEGMTKMYCYNFENTNLNGVLKAAKPDGSLYQFSAENPWYFVPIDVSDGYGFVYLAAIEKNNIGEFYYQWLVKEKKWVRRDTPDYSALLDAGDTSSNDYYGTGNAVLVRTWVPTPLNPPTYRADDGFVVVGQAGEREDAEAPISLQPSTIGTQHGMATFGESFASVKDLLRRYEVYLVTKYYIPKRVPIGITHFSIPILIQGMDVDTLTNPVYNTIRDPISSVLAAAFRFFRGSMNLRFVVDSSTSNVGIWLQHKPDVALDRLVMYPTNRSQVSTTLNRGYAFAYQNVNVNNQILINVPFYQRGALGYLQRPVLSSDSLANFYSLGNIDGGFHTGADRVNIQLMVFSSIGDDARYMEFIGFPPVFPITSITSPPNPSSLTFATGESPPLCNPRSIIVANGEGLTKAIRKSFNAIAMDPIRKLVKNVYDAAVEKLDNIDDVVYYARVSAALEALVLHVMFDDNRGRAIALINLFRIIVVDSLFGYHKLFTSKLEEVLQTTVNAIIPEALPNEPRQQCSASGEAPPKKDEGVMLPLVTTLVQTLGVWLGLNDVKAGKPFTKRWAKHLHAGFLDVSRSTTGIMTFIRNLFQVVSSIWKWFYSKLCPSYRLKKYIKEHQPIVDLFMKEASVLLDPSKSDYFLVDSSYMARLEVAIFVGELVERTLTAAKVYEVTSVAPILDKLRLLIKLRADCNSRGVSAVSRREPFALYLAGASGIGKSQLVSTLAGELLKSEGIKVRAEPIYTHSCLNAHFNGCRDQPVFVFDDYGQIKNSTMDDHHILMLLKSPAIFTPPQAALEDKKLRYQPEIVIACANEAFPRTVSINDSMALWRRRDFLVGVRLSPEYQGILERHGVHSIAALPPAIQGGIKNFNHLEFGIYDIATDDQAQPRGWINYNEFLALLKLKVNTYRKAQFELWNERRAVFDGVNFDFKDDSLESVPDLIAQIRKIYKGEAEDKLLNDEVIKEIWGEVLEPKTEEDIYEHIRSKTVSGQGGGSLSKDKSKAPKTTSQKIKSLLPDALIKDAPRFRVEYHCGPLPVLTKSQIQVCEDQYQGICDHVNKGRLFDLRWYQGEGECEPYPVFPHEVTQDSDNTDKVRLHSFNIPCGEMCILRAKDPVANAYLVHVVLKHPFAKRFKDYLIQMIGGDRTSVRDQIVFKDLKPRTRWTQECDYRYTKAHDFDTIKKKVGLLRTTIGVIKRMVMPVFILGGIYYGVSWGLDKWFGPKQADSEGVYASQDTGKGKAKKEGVVRKKFEKITTWAKSTPNEAGGEAGFDSVKGLIRKVKRNTGFLCFEGVDTNTGRTISGYYRFVGIYQNIALVPVHYFVTWNMLDSKTRKCSVMFSDVTGKPVTLPVDPSYCDLRTDPDSELAMMQMPASVGCFRDLTRNMRTERDWNSALPSEGVFVEIDANFDLIQVPVNMKMAKNVRVTFENVETTTVKHVISYNYHGKGKCMSFIVDGSANGTLLGFHIAGDGKNGYAQPVMREDFVDPSEEIIDSADGSDLEVYLDGEADPRLVLEGEVSDMGVVRAKFAHSETGKTNICKSAIHGVFPVTTEPNPLHPGDPRIGGQSPMLLGCEKHGLPTTKFDKREMAIAEQDYLDLILDRCKPIRTIDCITYQEAVEGIPGVKGFKSIELSTSEGFPYTGMRPPGARNKKWLISNGDKFGLHPILKGIMREKMIMRRAGIIPTTVFTDCLKDTRLPLAKCRVPGKTRVFSTSPLDFTIHWRKYFGDFTMAYINAQFDVGHAMCISPEGVEWTRLFNYLSEVGNKFLCGDYKNFGAGFSADAHMAAHRIALAWYRYNNAKEEDEKVRRVMAYELVTAVHLGFNTVYRTHCGMPSGSPATTPTNCKVNNLYIRLAWRAIFEFWPKMRAFSSMHKNLRFVVLGDDVIMCVSDAAAPYFNNVTLSKYFASVGVEYTDSSKQGIAAKWCSWDEATFLKRNFLPHPSRPFILMAALERDSVTDTANWIWKSPDVIEASMETSYACLLNSFGHGKEFFNYVRDKLQRAWRQLNIDRYPTFRQWEELDDIFYEALQAYIVQPYPEVVDVKFPGVGDSPLTAT